MGCVWVHYSPGSPGLHGRDQGAPASVESLAPAARRLPRCKDRAGEGRWRKNAVLIGQPLGSRDVIGAEARTGRGA